jgi:hypothetical protein
MIDKRNVRIDDFVFQEVLISTLPALTLPTLTLIHPSLRNSISETRAVNFCQHTELLAPHKQPFAGS